MDLNPRYFIKGSAELIGSFPSNQNTLYSLCLFYSNIEIITVHDRPAICTFIGWVKNSQINCSLSGFCGMILILVKSILLFCWVSNSKQLFVFICFAYRLRLNLNKFKFMLPCYVNAEKWQPTQHKATNYDSDCFCCLCLHFEFSHL